MRSERTLFAIPLLVPLLFIGLNFRLIGDEGLFHLNAITSFANKGIFNSLPNYSSASTPLPYLIWTIYGKIFGYEIWKLRLLSVIITYLAAIQFYKLCIQCKLPYPIISTFLMLFFPYIYFYGFTIYTVNFGLYFGIWALRYYLIENTRKADLFRGSMLATLAIYCRQYYLVLPIGMLFFETLQLDWKNIGSSMKQRYRRFCLLALPIIFVVPLFFLWRGLTPPYHQTDHFVHPILNHLSFLPIFNGVYFLPSLISSFRGLIKYKKVFIFTLMILVIMYFIFPVYYSEEPNKIAAATGIIVHGIDIFGKITNNFFARCLQIIIWLFGLMTIYSEVMRLPWDDIKSKIFALLIAFLILLSLTPYVAERYYMLTIPYFILVLYRSFYHRRLLIAWLIFQISLSASFTYWQVFLKSWNV